LLKSFAGLNVTGCTLFSACILKIKWKHRKNKVHWIHPVLSCLWSTPLVYFGLVADGSFQDPPLNCNIHLFSMANTLRQDWSFVLSIFGYCMQVLLCLLCRLLVGTTLLEEGRTFVLSLGHASPVVAIQPDLNPNDGTASHRTNYTWTYIWQSWCGLYWSCSDQAWTCATTYNVCVFVSLTVKAVHLELVSDINSENLLPAYVGLLLSVADLLLYGAIKELFHFYKNRRLKVLSLILSSGYKACSTTTLWTLAKIGLGRRYIIDSCLFLIRIVCAEQVFSGSVCALIV
jgi:hypothetical protein